VESLRGIRIFVETGNRWVFTGAVDWPGWCRRGKDEALALQELMEAGPRYAKALSHAEVSFIVPKSLDDFKVHQRIEGNATTDFGAPDAPLDSDLEQVNSADLERFRAILHGCWEDFDRTVKSAQGKELRLGPRGGGRDLAKIIEHIIGSDASYLGRIGWKKPKDAGASEGERLKTMRKAILEGLEASGRGELPEKGPRGGLRWPARRFVRRVAWHTLDHAWEIEDRLV
jgi:hypothetical protein